MKVAGNSAKLLIIRSRTENISDNERRKDVILIDFSGGSSSISATQYFVLFEQKASSEVRTRCEPDATNK